MESNINDQPERYFLGFIRTRRVNQKVSNELRSLIIAALNHGRNFTEIKTLFNGLIEKIPNDGNHEAKLTGEQKESLCDILEEDCSRTIQRTCDLFLERHNLRIDKKFFIYETGFQVNMICLYGRELTGIRATKIVSALRSRNYSVSCTISYEGMVNVKINERAYNAECFLEYF
ncbi:hypothetical protein RF11_14797 [Thelohanellus kitauei]|uniref:Uncharacterized protein n=1 Tax=Thelohanellus kitauei TaxID=669202 RepID=A0A0C2IH84_THEKT|nr:hypothetical protein RF11_14797 [Thelohanellus kitauei]